MARITSQECGERAFDVLCTHIGGVSRRMWRYHCDLNESQLRRGLDWLRDLFGEGKAFCRVWRGGEWIYTLGDGKDVHEHAERHQRTQITRAEREDKWWEDKATEFPTEENQWQRELARQRLAHLRHAYRSMFGEEAA